MACIMAVTIGQSLIMQVASAILGRCSERPRLPGVLGRQGPRTGGSAVEPADRQGRAVRRGPPASTLPQAGVAKDILKTRLDGFVSAGDHGAPQPLSSPDHHQYLLDRQGREGHSYRCPDRWADRWTAPAGPPDSLCPLVCGDPITVQTTCHLRPGPRPAEIQVRPGPGMPADIDAPYGLTM